MKLSPRGFKFSGWNQAQMHTFRQGTLSTPAKIVYRSGREEKTIIFVDMYITDQQWCESSTDGLRRLIEDTVKRAEEELERYFEIGSQGFLMNYVCCYGLPAQGKRARPIKSLTRMRETR